MGTPNRWDHSGSFVIKLKGWNSIGFRLHSGEQVSENELLLSKRPIWHFQARQGNGGVSRPRKARHPGAPGPRGRFGGGVKSRSPSPTFSGMGDGQPGKLGLNKLGGPTAGQTRCGFGTTRR